MKREVVCVEIKVVTLFKAILIVCILRMIPAPNAL